MLIRSKIRKMSKIDITYVQFSYWAIVLVIVFFFFNCIQENCGTGKMYPTTANDSMSIQLNVDTMKLFITGNTSYYDKLIKSEIRNENSLADTIKIYFFMSGEHRMPGTQPKRNYEWLKDSLQVWFTFREDSLQNGDCPNGQVLAKTNCSPVPNNIDVDSILILKSQSKEIEIIEDWDEVNDPDNKR